VTNSCHQFLSRVELESTQTMILEGSSLNGLVMVERERVAHKLERRESESDFPFLERESSQVIMRCLGPKSLIYSLHVITELPSILNVPNSILITGLTCNYKNCIIKYSPS